MGILRLLLALSVLSSHSQEKGIYFFEPGPAVLAFFIISGFYMALILDGKYKSKIHFYISRALRIFPLYWVMLFITLTLGILKVWFHIGGEENAIIHYLKYSNHLTSTETVNEAINFIFRNLTLIINKDYFSIKDNIAPGYLVIYTAWSLQVELLFYLAVPFIVKLKNSLFFFVILYCIIFYGFVEPFSIISQNTLTFKFFESLIYFLLGMCSYQYIYKAISSYKPNVTYYIILFVFITYIATYQFLPGKIVNQDFIISFVFYLPFALALPFIFSLTKLNRFDRFLGELSYPVYISHLIFVKILLSFHHPQILFLNTFVVSVATISFSVIIVRYIQIPIDKFRHKKLRTKT